MHSALLPNAFLRATVTPWWSRITITFLFVVVFMGVIAEVSPAPLPGAFVVLAFATTLLLVIESLRGSTRTSGLMWHTNTLRLTGYGAALAFGMIAVIILTAFVFGARFAAVVPNTTVAMLTALCFVVVSATLEEVLFRGTVFEALHERFGASVAVGSTSLVFALLHALNPHATFISIANTALAGSVLGVLVAQSHSLYAAIAFHVMWNVLVGSIVGTVSGMDLGIGLVRLDMSDISLPWLFGNAYGIEEGALTTGLLTVGVLFVLKTVPLDAETRAARFRRSFLNPLESAS